MGQGQAHDLVTRVDQGSKHRSIGLRAGVRLHVSELGTKQGLGAVTGQVLHHVDVLAAAIVAAAWVALGVLVGQHGALRLQHGARNEVLRGDHLEGAALAGDLARDGVEDLGVKLAHLLVAHVSRVRSGHESVVSLLENCRLQKLALHPNALLPRPGDFGFPLIA